ncbi:hypothetical protein ACVWWJ_003525 [Luteibacter sp. HA06]|jgi:hypothetical protein
MRKVKLDYSYEVRCVRHESDVGASCFSADAIIRDADGKEVARIVGKRVHSYVEAAEDEAVESARLELKRLNAGLPTDAHKQRS